MIIKKIENFIICNQMNDQTILKKLRFLYKLLQAYLSNK